MDSLTHIALGAVIGEAMAGKAVGKKAMLIGAAAQSLPDIDFVMSLWLRPVDNLLAHRGFTHSLLFCVVVSILIGWALQRWRPFSNLPNKKWMIFIGLQMSIHLLLDAFNSYGVGWFEPFNHIRIAFDILFVADPFYSIWLGLASVVLLVLKGNAPSRRFWIGASLILSSLYLAYAIYNKVNTEQAVRRQLRENAIVYSRLLTTPTPLNNWLWYIVAETDSGYQTGYRSVFDEAGLKLTYFPRQAELLRAEMAEKEVDKLLRFSKGYYTIERKDEALLFNDLRFGQITGWSNPRAPFSFHYDLQNPGNNLFVVQQGRFSNWNAVTIKQLVARIRGRKAQKG